MVGLRHAHRILQRTYCLPTSRQGFTRSNRNTASARFRSARSNSGVCHTSTSAYPPRADLARCRCGARRASDGCAVEWERCDWSRFLGAPPGWDRAGEAGNAGIGSKGQEPAVVNLLATSGEARFDRGFVRPWSLSNSAFLMTSMNNADRNCQFHRKETIRERMAGVSRG